VFVDQGKAIVGSDFEVLRWELSESEQPANRSVLFKPAGDGFMMSANGQLGASVTNRDKEIVVQEVSTGKIIDSWTPALEEIEAIALSADGAFLAAWPDSKRDSEAGQVHIHRLHTKNKDIVLRHPKPRYGNRHSEIQSVCFADHNQRIVTSDTRAIRVWRNPAAQQRSGNTSAKRKGTHGQ
jgi:hypothetical protein